MATATCPECDTPTRGASRCPECRTPVKGQPRKAPAGSGVKHGPHQGTARGWDGAVFGTVVLLLVVGFAVWLL